MQKIFDSHFHLWDLDRVHLEWLSGNLQKNVLYDELLGAYQDLEFIGGMYVEVNSADVKSEEEFALDLKRQYGIELCLPSLAHESEICAFREVLHVSQRGAKRLLDSDFKEILKRLEKLDIVFEACMKNEEIIFLQSTLTSYPKLKVCLNHFGSPTKEHFTSYTQHLKELSKFNNLFIKLSAPDNLSLENKEFILAVFQSLKENFGEQRLMYGSNFPVAKISPRAWVECIIQSGVFSDLDGIFYNNALRFYKGV